MPDPTQEVQQYLNRPLDDLFDELALYREAATGGTEKGTAVWQTLLASLHQIVYSVGT